MSRAADPHDASSISGEPARDARAAARVALDERGAPAEGIACDWNELARARRGPLIPATSEFVDETLRDGLQNPSVLDPPIAKKLELLHLMDSLGITVANVGLPGSSRRAFEDCLLLCREVAENRLKIQVSAAGRTVVGDIEPMVELSQRAGLPVQVYAFVGCSPIRALAEQWDLARLRQLSVEAIDVGVRNGLETTYVTEDTTRARPEVLAELFGAVLDRGASGLCLCDTVGHATPDGVRNLIHFTRHLLASRGHQARIDWHGHNDRGLALTNSIYALEVGADRVHGTALGIGERVGNAPMELILLNLRMLGMLPGRDLSRLPEYCERAAAALGWTLAASNPFSGRDARAVAPALLRGEPAPHPGPAA